MRISFFQILVRSGGGPEEEALNQLIASKRIHDIKREFVADGENSFWAICVTWQETSARAGESNRKARIDYREVLSEADFAIYARLREVRKSIAASDGVPPYAVFTNEQLAEIAKRRSTSISALKEIEGIGAAKVEKYGQQMIAALQS